MGRRLLDVIDAMDETVDLIQEREGHKRRQVRMFIWSRNFQSGVTMNILMTSCGCSRLEAVAKSASKEMRGPSGWVEREGWKGETEKNRLQQKGSPRSLLSLEIIIAPLTVARLVRFSAFLFSSVSSCLVRSFSLSLQLQDAGFILR